jgi:hypothetical protein
VTRDNNNNNNNLSDASEFRNVELTCNFTVTEQFSVAVMFQTCIAEMSGLQLGKASLLL